MSFHRRTFVAPTAIVLALSLMPMLTACGGNPIQGIIQGATGGQLDVGGTTVPADFPAEVPLVSGEVVAGVGLGSGDGKIWNVSIKIPDASAIDGISAQLTEAGFEKVGDTATSDDGSSSMFTKDPYGVLVIVAKDDKTGFVANYTVTFTKSDS